MSGGSQHNPNGRQSQLGPGWSPLQVANLLARAPQAHMASDRGVTWHTPTPPPHLYHVPAPSPPDPLQGLLQLQAMKAAGGNSVFRHTATPPELYRHTPTPPEKHHMRHTPSPGDIKGSAALPPVELYPHLGPGRDKLVRADELLAYARVGVDLSLSSGRAANGAPHSPAPPAPPAPAAAAAPTGTPAAPALSVRDAPTINSLIARAQPRHPHARVDALLERLIPSPVSPHSVIVHSRAAPTPSPPSSNEDSADSCGAPPGSKRKRKPERTVRVGVPGAPPPLAPPAPAPAAPLSPAPAAAPAPAAPMAGPRAELRVSPPRENGEAHEPEQARAPSPSHARRKTRSGSAETIDDIAAMIAEPAAPPVPPPEPTPAVSVDKLHSVLAGPPDPPPAPVPTSAPAPAPACAPAATPAPAPAPDAPAPTAGPAAAPRRRSARNSNADAPNVPVESPSEAKPAEPEASDARTAEPAAASFVEVENQLEKMFAGLEEEPRASPTGEAPAGDTQTDGEVAAPTPTRKRRRSAPGRSDRRPPRPVDDRKKPQRKKVDARRPKKGKEPLSKDAYDSGSNASSSRSRGPYIQVRGPRDSPLSVCVVNTAAGSDEEAGARRKQCEEFRNGVRGARARPGRGLHASTLGLRYDATTPDATWLCAFCSTGPHHAALGDLFGPYALDTDCDEYRALDEATRRRYGSRDEVWFHEACGVWAPGLVAAGARLWGLPAAVWGARAQRCAHCAAPPAPLACAARGCRARAHLPCARAHRWLLRDHDFRALCPRHAHPPP